MIKALLIVSAAFMVSNCATSTPESNSTSMNPQGTETENVELAENEESSGKEELICKREAITGSHRKTKTCLTRAQSEKAKADSRAFVDRLKMTPEPKSSDGG